MRKSAFLLTVLTTTLAALAGAQTAIWSQGWDVRGTVPDSSKTSDGAIDQEIADDFDVTGRVDMVETHGGYLSYFNSPPMGLTGVVVRFYEAQGSLPGALLYERTVPASAVVQTDDGRGDLRLRIPLPVAFQAGGRHFLSVQTLSSLSWSWHTANSAAPSGATMALRDRKAGTGWRPANLSDAAFALYGATTGAPRVDRLSDASLPRSGRLRLFGSDFGPAETGRVEIGGQRAIVARWSTTEIHAYVPESAALGQSTVRIVSAAGTSASVGLTVVSRRSPGGRARWRFQVDGPGLIPNVVVAPDGAVYAMDDVGIVYGLTLDGGLRWATPAG